MSSNDIKCPKCNAICRVTELCGGKPGGKESEEARCPDCGEFLESRMISGVLNVVVIKPGSN